MKHLLPITALASVLALAGCSTQVGVNNPDNPSATYSVGTLTTTYKSDVSAVFAATKRALDSMRDVGVIGRTGETPVTNELGDLVGMTVYARAYGDISVKVEITKATDAATGSECTQVNVRWGVAGNCQQSQQIVHRISDNLGR